MIAGLGHLLSSVLRSQDRSSTAGDPEPRDPSEVLTLGPPPGEPQAAQEAQEAQQAQPGLVPPSAVNLEWARAAVGSMGMAAPSHRRLAHNLAFAVDRMSPASQEELRQSGPPSLAIAQDFVIHLYGRDDRPHQDFRLACKLERDLERPYSDGAVDARLEFLERRLREHLQASPTPRFWLAGSLLKGHFGANSDLDVITPGATPPRDRPDHDLQIRGLDGKSADEVLAFYGQSVELEAADFLGGKVRLRDFLA